MKKEVMEKIAALITAAFGLVAALAWNDTIKAIFSEIFGSTNQLVPMIVYAVLVTVIAVLATMWIGNIAEKLEK
ncbi:hypothetical protein KO317_02990 [Candidatus Micrarchaeota archaeon]|jgi:hypothetical protein|nr:hypothetical protein [Candidatus Micrarchaeota archaeon]